MLKILFIDIDQTFPNLAAQKFGETYYGFNIETMKGDIRDVLGDNICYLSPANSLLYFDGGIDLFYGNMFPSLQSDAQTLVKKYGFNTKDLSYGHYPNFPKKSYYLPVGSALIVPTRHKSQKKIKKNFIVACPTMFLPSDVRGTRNAYYAFYAALSVIKKYNQGAPDVSQIKVLVCPGLGTGVGKISFNECVEQISDAIIDFSKGKNNHDKLKDDKDAYIYNAELNQ